MWRNRNRKTREAWRETMLLLQKMQAPVCEWIRETYERRRTTGRAIVLSRVIIYSDWLRSSRPRIHHYAMDQALCRYSLPQAGTEGRNCRGAGRDVAFHTVKKTKCWIWKAFCRTTGELIDWECGDRSSETLWPLLARLTQYNVKVYFSDGWDGYAELIPPDMLIQTKAETHGIERNNSQQRHWFARFRRRTCVVSRSLHMVNVTMSLFSYFHSSRGKATLFDLFPAALFIPR